MPNVIWAQSSKIFSDMLEEALMDAVLQAHQEVLRSKAVCEICHTRYALSAIHVPWSFDLEWS